MYCRAYCSTTSYRLPSLYLALKERFSVKQYRDLIHVEVPLVSHETADLFIFAYGVAVFWGFPTEDDEKKFLSDIKSFEVDPYDFVEDDVFTYTVGQKAKIADDEIVLTDLQSLSLISVSHAIAQSVKLGSFEQTVQNTWNKMKGIPEQLAKNGTISQSRRKIRQQIGTLFLERAFVNLHVDVLGIPEFFWEYPEIEPLYRMTAHYLEIQSRADVLNRRLNVIYELFEMLVAELNHQHSTHLEWAIIILISFEISLFLFHEIFKLV
jgi:uncharacterized Rmd1/YagE family protein